MFPLRDYTRRRRTLFPYVNVTFVAINILVFLYQIALGPQANEFIVSWGATPREIFRNVDLPPEIPVPVYFTIISSMFIHGSIFHIGGNMLFLWVFGDNVEDSMGHFRYLVFYLLAGIIAAFSQMAFDIDSPGTMIGASGAVAGVLGGYIVTFPRGQITTLIILGIIPLIIRLPALVMIGYWAAIQLFLGVAGIRGVTAVDGGVAFFAHVGGFIAGALLIFVFRSRY